MTQRKRTLPSETYELGKLPPQAIEIEEAILGAIMLQPSAMDYSMLHITPAMFYREINHVIFSAAVQLRRENKPVDSLTIINQLKFTGQLELVGGPYYISQLPVLNVGPFEEWCAILKQKFSRRECIRIGSELVRIGYDDMIDELDSYAALDDNHKVLSDLLFGNYQVQTFQDIAHQSLAELKSRIEFAQQGLAGGISTGLRDLDTALGGWSNGDLVIIAGRPGMGKTAIALHHAKVAAQQGKHVYMFSLEMTNTRLADRVIVGETDVNNYRYKLGRIGEHDLQTIEKWVQQRSNLPIHLDEKSFVNIDYIVSNARMRKRKNQLDIMVIDYLQLIDMAQDRNGTRDQAIGIVTRKLKSLAKELNIPILLLSQLSRKSEDRGGDRRPKLHDLRESGNIEQDADIVIFCYRPAYYGIEQFNNQPTAGMMVLDVSKNRNGESNVDIICEHNESLTQFSDKIKDDDNEGELF